MAIWKTKKCILLFYQMNIKTITPQILIVKNNFYPNFKRNSIMYLDKTKHSCRSAVCLD